MTTLSFFSATGGELTLVSQALSRLRTRGLDITLFGRTKDQITDPELARPLPPPALCGAAFCPIELDSPHRRKHPHIYRFLCCALGLRSPRSACFALPWLGRLGAFGRNAY